jgi:hypothetical protein
MGKGAEGTQAGGGTDEAAGEGDGDGAVRDSGQTGART